MNGAKVTKRVPNAGVGKMFDWWATVSLKCGRVAVEAEGELIVLEREEHIYYGRWGKHLISCKFSLRTLKNGSHTAILWFTIIII